MYIYIYNIHKTRLLPSFRLHVLIIFAIENTVRISDETVRVVGVILTLYRENYFCVVAHFVPMKCIYSKYLTDKIQEMGAVSVIITH